MQIGSIISGERGGSFVLEATLGQQGMFGQVYLGYRVDEPDATERYAVKTLRPDRPKSDRDQLLQEIETLKCMQAIEESNNAHYAVRLIDYAPPNAEELFIVMELASGQNVQTDIINVADWKYQPPPEQDMLHIAWQFAQALSLAHLAFICYDDMKLENLFWEPQRQHPLRIIDWNVTSSVREQGVSGDWARFGACLHQLLTGVALGGNADLTVLYQRPEDAPLWSRLSDGLQRIILRALHPEISNRYQKDSDVLDDLRREKDALAMDTKQLIEQGQVALERNRFEEARAWLARANQKSPNRSDIATLLSKASQGARESQSQELQVGCQLLQRNEFRAALELLEQVYFNSEQTYTPARRLAWLARFARAIYYDPSLYAQLEPEIAPMIDLLASDLAQTSPNEVSKMMGKMRRMNRVFAQFSNQPELEWLASELSVLAIGKDLQAFTNRIAVSDNQNSLEAQQQELAHKREELKKRAAPLQAAVDNAKDLVVLLKDLNHQLDIAQKQIEQHQRIESLTVSAEREHTRAKQLLEETEQISEQDRSRYTELLKDALRACDHAERAYKGEAAMHGIEQLRGMLQPKEEQKLQQVRSLRSKIDLYQHISDATIVIQQQQPFLQSTDLRERFGALKQFDRVYQIIASLRANNPNTHQQIDAVLSQLDRLQATLQTNRDLLDLYDSWTDARTRQNYTAETDLLEQLQRQRIETGRRGEDLAYEYQRAKQEANDIGNLLANAAREQAAAKQFLREAQQSHAIHQREQLLAKAHNACEQAVAFYKGPRGIEKIRGELRPEESRQYQDICDTICKDVQEARAANDELQRVYTQWIEVRENQEYQRALDLLKQLQHHQIVRGQNNEDLMLAYQRTRQRLLFQQANDIFKNCLTQYNSEEIEQVLHYIEDARALDTSARDVDSALDDLHRRVEYEQRAWERFSKVKNRYLNQPISPEYYKTLQELAKQSPESRWLESEVAALQNEWVALFDSQSQALERRISSILQQNVPYESHMTSQLDEVDQEHQALRATFGMLPDELTTSRFTALEDLRDKLKERIQEQEEQARNTDHKLEELERDLRRIAHAIQSSSLEEGHKQVDAIQDRISQLRSPLLTAQQRERLDALEEDQQRAGYKVALEHDIKQTRTDIGKNDWTPVKDRLEQVSHRLSKSNLSDDDIAYYQKRLELLQNEATQQENNEKGQEYTQQIEKYIQEYQYETAVSFGRAILGNLPDGEINTFRFEIERRVKQAEQKQALRQEAQALHNRVEEHHRNKRYQSALEAITRLQELLSTQTSDDPQVKEWSNDAQRTKDSIEEYLNEMLEQARQQSANSLESAQISLDKHVLQYHPAYQPALAFQQELDEQILAQQFAEEAEHYRRQKTELDKLQQDFWHADAPQRERSTHDAAQIAKDVILFSAGMSNIETTLNRLGASLDTATLDTHWQALRQRQACRNMLWLQLLLYRQELSAYSSEYSQLFPDQDIPTEQMARIDSQYQAWQEYQQANEELQQELPKLAEAAQHIAAAEKAFTADAINNLRQRIDELIQREKELREMQDTIGASLKILRRPDYQQDSLQSLPELQSSAENLIWISAILEQDLLLRKLFSKKHDQQRQEFVELWETVANTVVRQAQDIGGGHEVTDGICGYARTISESRMPVSNFMTTTQDITRLTAIQLSDLAKVVTPFLLDAAPKEIQAVQQQVHRLALLQQTENAINNAQLQTASGLLREAQQAQQVQTAPDDLLLTVQQRLEARQTETRQHMAQVKQAYTAFRLNEAQKALDTALTLDSENGEAYTWRKSLTNQIQQQQTHALKAYALQAENLPAAVQLWDDVCAAFADGTLEPPDQPSRLFTDWRDEAHQQLEDTQQEGKRVQAAFATLLDTQNLHELLSQSRDQVPGLLERIQAVTKKLPKATDLHNLQQIIQYYHDFAEDSERFAGLVLMKYSNRPDDWLKQLEEAFPQFQQSYNSSLANIEDTGHELAPLTSEALARVLGELETLRKEQMFLLAGNQQETGTVNQKKKPLFERILRRENQ